MMSDTHFRTRIKICCIADPEEAKLAIRYGADALGLVAAMPSGPGVIADNTAKSVAVMVPPPISTFLLTSETTAEGIASHVKFVGTTAVQIVHHIDPAESEKLVRLIPGIRRVQVIHVEGPETLELIKAYQDSNSALLLDSGRPRAPVPELGGTGRVHDWSISKQIVEQSRLPVILAGGLTPENVAEAIAMVKPYGVDLCSGVRTDNKLDEAKLNAFIRAVRGTDRI